MPPGATIMLKIPLIMVKILKRHSSYCRDSTQACHPYHGQTGDLQTPCGSLCWPHNGRSCPVFLPPENKTFPQEHPCSSLPTPAHGLCAASHGMAQLSNYPVALGLGMKFFPLSRRGAARPRSFRLWCKLHFLVVYICVCEKNWPFSLINCLCFGEEGISPHLTTLGWVRFRSPNCSWASDLPTPSV